MQNANKMYIVISAFFFRTDWALPGLNLVVLNVRVNLSRWCDIGFVNNFPCR